MRDHGIARPRPPALNRGDVSTPIGVLGLLGLTMALASLDLIGSIAAAEWSRHGDALRWVAGAAVFLAMFGLYGWTLHFAHLTVVDSVWIAFGLVGAAAVDFAIYRVRYPIDVVVALGALIALSVYVAWRMQ